MVKNVSGGSRNTSIEMIRQVVNSEVSSNLPGREKRVNSKLLTKEYVVNIHHTLQTDVMVQLRLTHTYIVLHIVFMCNGGLLATGVCFRKLV